MKTKSKGNRFEIRIAKQLTKWASGKEKPLWYWRSSGSGAQATITKDYKSPMLGDIMAVDPRGSWLTDIFMFALRDRKTTNVLDFLHPSKSVLSMKTWYYEELEKAKKADRQLALIFHRYGSVHDYIAMNDFTALKCYISTNIKIRLEFGTEALYVYSLKHFLQIANPIVIAREFIGEVIAEQVQKNYYVKKRKKIRK